MATKDSRVELRVSQDDREVIEDAAARIDESISDFTRGAALERAHKILGRSNTTLMDADQFDALLDSLDTPDEAPALARAIAAPRRFRRR